jgi:glycosyltransferase involved in cell wall biosynthesis
MDRIKYVTSFPGARDAYELPYTLHKNDRLDLFITDIYNKGLLKTIPIQRFKNKLKGRMADGDTIPHGLIRNSPQIIVQRKVADRFNHPAVASVIEDDMYAKAAVDAARRHKSGLFLYEFQAEYAFSQKLSHHAPKHVFYFHPHPSLEHPMLLADAEKYPAFKEDARANTRQSFAERFRDHTKGAWKNADHIFVASSFTKKSLLFAGASEDKITVAPYGAVLTEPYEEVTPSEQPYFLFVGSGAHRKGLHHLLEAWTRSGLFKNAKLVVVSRVADKYNAALLQNTQGVEWKRGISRSQLVDLYKRASLFVLPSMSEGFGHVYLEALHFGCPVLGTDHSVLADVHGSPDVIYKVEPANVDQLTAMLIALWASQPGRDIGIRRKAAAIGSEFTWERFQDVIENTLKHFDP